MRFFKLLRHLLWERSKKGEGAREFHHALTLYGDFDLQPLVNSGFNKTLDSRLSMDKFLIMFTVSSLVTLV